MRHIQVHSIHPKRQSFTDNDIKSFEDIFVKLSAITDLGILNVSFTNVYVDGDEFDAIVSKIHHTRSRFIFDQVASVSVGSEYVSRSDNVVITKLDDQWQLSQLSIEPEGYYE